MPAKRPTEGLPRGRGRAICQVPNRDLYFATTIPWFRKSTLRRCSDLTCRLVWLVPAVTRTETRPAVTLVLVEGIDGAAHHKTPSRRNESKNSLCRARRFLNCFSNGLLGGKGIPCMPRIAGDPQADGVALRPRRAGIAASRTRSPPMRMTFFCSLTACLLVAAPAAAQVASMEQPSVLPAETANKPWTGYVYQPQPANQAAEAMAGQPASEPEESCGSPCQDGGCDCQCDRWFASVAGLVMGRDKANAFWTSYESGNNANQVLNTNNASADWSGGFELTLGRWFDCSPCGEHNGLEVVYFYLDPMRGYADVLGSSLPAGTVSTTLDLTTPTGQVQVGGQNVGLFFDGAAEHRIWRDDQFQNLELNFLHDRLVNTDAAQITWLAGIRYFRFDESLIYGSVMAGHHFGDDGGADEAYLSFSSTNNMVGPQWHAGRLPVGLEPRPVCRTEIRHLWKRR